MSDSATNKVSERDYASLIASSIRSAAATNLIDVAPDFIDYFELICTRALFLPHRQPSHKDGSGVLALDDLIECPVLRAFVRFLDADMHAVFDHSEGSSRFHPMSVRNIHRQYLQLDADKSGLLSADELSDFGKKRAFNPAGREPTHDLTDAFVAQVFCQVPSFDGELDYKAYIDFALVMADKTSLAALRVR